MTARFRRPVTAAATLVLATTMLAGCFSVESNITINDDATADIELVTLIDTDQLQQFSEMLGEDAGQFDGLSGDELIKQLTEGDDPCGDLDSSFSGYEVTTEQVEDGAEVGVRCTVRGIPLDELSTIGADSSFTIEQDETGTRFSAVLGGLDDLETSGEDVSQMLDVNLDDIFSISFSATAPGSLGENNASSTDGATATWNITGDAGFVTDGDATMTAAWTPGGGSGGNSWWIIALAVVAVALAVSLAFALLHRRGRPTPVAASPDSPGVAMATSPPPPPPGSTSPPHPPGSAPPPPPSPSAPPPPPASPSAPPPPPPI